MSFRSASDQDPKAAKYAVLVPGPGMFVNVRNAPRVVPEGPCSAVCALVCDLSRKAECVPAFGNESERGPFVGEVEKCDEKRFGTKFMAAALPDISLLLMVRVHKEPGNACI